MKLQLRIKTRNNFLIYLLLIAQVASLGVFDKLIVIGRPFSAYIRYIVFLISFLNLFIYIVETKLRKLVAIWFFFSFTLTAIIGYMHSHDLMNVLIEASHYVTIVSIYYWVIRHEYSFNRIIKIIYIVIPVLLITSVLSSLGYLHGMNDISGGLYRSSIDVDGTIGVIATLTVFHELNRKAKALVLDYLEFVMGCMVVAFSISRGRIAVLIVCIAIYLLITLKCRNVSRFKKLLPLLLTVVILIVLFSDIVLRLFNQILIRFQMSSGDLNLTRRLDEIRCHLLLFKQYPVFGMGWGMLAKNSLYDHCSYSAVLAFMGVVGGVPYLYWFFEKLFFSLFKSMKDDHIGKYHLAFIMTFSVMLLAIANMSFNKTGGIWGMLIAYIALNNYDSTEVSEK